MKIGQLQVPGGKCPDHFHCNYWDQIEHGCNATCAIDSECPTCGAVRFPGNIVSKAFANEYNCRKAMGSCLSINSKYRFPCNNLVERANLAEGCHICNECQDREQAYEGYCDGEASRYCN